MKMQYAIDRMVIEFEEETVKDLFRTLAEVQSIFEADKVCGRCDSTRIQCRVRGVEEGDYYELVCADCASTLSLGQTRTGSLFPKRKDKEGNALEKNGWRVAWTNDAPMQKHPATGRAGSTGSSGNSRLPASSTGSGSGSLGRGQGAADDPPARRM